MRLLTWNDDNELILTGNLYDDQIPPYATLSHTWAEDDEEVTFVDFRDRPSQCQSKVGYEKIQFCGRQARRDGIKHFWVDTCCIDKANSSELSEAITSMYRWYHEARKCYVYLADVSLIRSIDEEETQGQWEMCFQKSRWFTRGWTLQELLAPQVVEFYSREGTLLGTKETLAQQIQQTTTISLAALYGTPLSQFSIAERWWWAKGRQTRRKEDQAYCLLGIFDMFMPLMYGEGSNAFHRLEKKIRRRFGADSTTCFHRDNDIIPVWHPRQTDSKAGLSFEPTITFDDQNPFPSRTVCTKSTHPCVYHCRQSPNLVCDPIDRLDRSIDCAEERSTNRSIGAVRHSSNRNEQCRSEPEVSAEFVPLSASEFPLGLAPDIRRGFQRLTTTGYRGREEGIREGAHLTVRIASHTQTPSAFQHDFSQLPPSDDTQYRIFFLRKKGSDWTQVSYTEHVMPIEEIKDRIRYGPTRSRRQKQNIKWMLDQMETRRRSAIGYLLQAVNRNDGDSRQWKIVAIDDEHAKLKNQNSIVNFFSVVLVKIPASAALA